MHAVSTHESHSAPPEIMTIEQVAVYLQLHPQVVYRHVRAGTLPASRIGRTIRFKKSVLDAFLENGAWEFANRYLNFVAQTKAQTRSSSTVKAEAEAVSAPRAPQTREVMVSVSAPEPSKQFSEDID